MKPCLVPLIVVAALCAGGRSHPAVADLTLTSPDGRNTVAARVTEHRLMVTILRDGRPVLSCPTVGLKITGTGSLNKNLSLIRAEADHVKTRFDLPWGKTRQVQYHATTGLLRLTDARGVLWELELQASADGVAFRYRLPKQEKVEDITVQDDMTQFAPVGDPTALYNTLDGFTTSHESLYSTTFMKDIPVNRLIDCPLLLTWQDGPAAAITEARVRQFAGMYLRRESEDSAALRCRLSPLPRGNGDSVSGTTPLISPWRVVLLADHAGRLIENNLLLCLNDQPAHDFSWAKPGKTTFHWWYGDFENDHKLQNEKDVYVARHRKYIDFCAENKIAYHAVSGDGYAWYQQSRTDYGRPADDADVCTARPELGLPEILEYAQQKKVGIRLWVHWKPLERQLEQAMTTYESWGVKGLMVDFLDRDDQEMITFVDRMLDSAARHKIHIQIHGCSKYSGEQRTFPHLFNREGVLNLEYCKWSNVCTPAHSVNVAYTRALAGPVDFHLGGFRCVSREDFRQSGLAPVVMGTRSHHLALYVVYENPMPMVADSPHVYEGVPAFDFIRRVPTTWEETRFVTGTAGEYVVVARRSGQTWYLAGITNWTPRKINVPLEFLAQGSCVAEIFSDGSFDESRPDDVDMTTRRVSASDVLSVSMAGGGGFAAILRPATGNDSVDLNRSPSN